MGECIGAGQPTDHERGVADPLEPEHRVHVQTRAQLLNQAQNLVARAKMVSDGDGGDGGSDDGGGVGGSGGDDGEGKR